jgi:predicted N-formylglutamate amidohydrolase
MFCVVTCEHASNRVPAKWKTLINNKRALNSHAGYDIGALLMARVLSRELAAPLFKGEVTRLLIDLNRSINGTQAYSKYTQTLHMEEKERLAAQYYYPYRTAVCEAIDDAEPGIRVLHLSIHSFTPRWQGQNRPADIGLLYDPARKAEAKFCEKLSGKLKQSLPNLRIRRNYPYRGSSDGFTTDLRRRYPMRRYLGLELEFNQALLLNPEIASKRLAIAIAHCIAELVH